MCEYEDGMGVCMSMGDQDRIGVMGVHYNAERVWAQGCGKTDISTA